MSADKAIRQVIKAAGKDAEATLMLLQTILSNIRNDPKEPKFRKLNPESGRLKKELLCYPGAKEFLVAAGFVEEAGHLVLKEAGVPFNDALGLVNRHFAALSEYRMRRSMHDSKGDEQKLYLEAVDGGAKFAGCADVQKLAGSKEGIEAMETLGKVLTNIRLFSTNERYRSVNLSGKAGQKLKPALALARLAGFEIKQSNGEEHAVWAPFDGWGDVIDRVGALLTWATSASARAIDMGKLLAMPSPQATAAAASLLGVAVGDALGGPLDMLDRMPLNAKEVDKALEMAGGGHWSLAPGQGTCATELTVGLVDALQASATDSSGVAAPFPLHDAGQVYCEWGQSQPFDMSDAIKTAFERTAAAPDLMRRALLNTKNNESNGALLRCTPLAAWGVSRKLSMEQIAQAAREDAQLSHSNDIVIEANAAYALAVAYLIEHPGDRAGTFRVLNDWLKCEKEKAKGTANASEFGAIDAVEEWLKEATGSEYFSFGPEVKSARVAFVSAFRQLHLGTTFEQAMRATICGGGEPSANAAIVGGLLGPAVGLTSIPERWIRAITACDTQDAAQPRPKRFQPKNIPRLVRHLFAA